MQFSFTEEQGLIRDTVAGFTQDWREAGGLRAPYSVDGYKALAQELGLAGITVPEALGGAGLGAVERAIVMEELGKVCFKGSYFSSAVRASDLLLAAGDETYLPQIASGELVAAVGEVKDGAARNVCDGAVADLLVLSNGDAISVVSRDGFEVVGVPCLDETRPLADITLNQAPNLISETGATKARVQSSIALAAEAVGIAQTALDMTVAYTQERVQFDRTIASFQAVKHRCADMMIAVESARSAVYYAACLANTDEAAEASAIAKAWATDAAFEVTGHAIQMHGGIGFTQDYDLQFFFKRARAARAMLGTPTQHYEQIADMIGLVKEGAAA